MRILVYALPRTGSTVLADYIAKSLNFKFIFEPFHIDSQYFEESYTDYDIWERKDVVIKTIWGQGGYWYPELKNRFDKVIILWRENVLEQAESFAFAASGGNMLDWHAPYVFASKQIPQEDINYQVSLLQDRYKEVELIDDFKTTYEKIFSTEEDLDRLDTHVGIVGKTFRPMLHKSNKYRRNKLEAYKFLI